MKIGRGWFSAALAAGMVLSLTGTAYSQSGSRDPDTIRTTKKSEFDEGLREYVSGSNGYKADANAIAMSTFGPNCTALAIRRRHKLPKDVYFVTGVIFANTRGGNVAGQTLGEGAGVSTVSYYGSIKIGSTLHPLFNFPLGVGGRELTLAPNGVARMYLAAPIPVDPQDVIWLQFSVETASPTAVICRPQFLDYTEPEAQTPFNNALPLDNTNAARARVDDSTWAPATVSRNVLLSPTAAPSVAAVTVMGDGPCIAGWGTSREIGKVNPYVVPTMTNDGYWQRVCEDKGIAYIDFAKGASRGFQDLSEANTVIRKQCMIGITHVLNGHNQNDLHVQTLSQFQATMKAWKNYCDSIAAPVIINTCYAWNQAETSTLNGLDNYVSRWPYPLADASVEVERRSWNTYLRAGGLLAGGDGVTLRSELGDIYLDTAVAIDDPVVRTNYADPRHPLLSGTIETATTNSFTCVSSGLTAFSTYDMTVISFTAANSPTIAQVRGNTPAGLFILDRSSAGLGVWSNGAPAVGKLWFISTKLNTGDGIHANENGRKRQAVIFKAWADTLVP